MGTNYKEDVDVVKTFTKAGYKAFSQLIRTSNSLPVGLSRKNFATHTSFNLITEHFTYKIINSSNKVLSSLGVKQQLISKDDESNIEKIIACNDTISEILHTTIDRSKLFKQPDVKVVPEILLSTSPAASVASWNVKPVIKFAKKGAITLFAATNVTRPQLTFKDPVDNSASRLWVPKIKFKPWSIKPLALNIVYDDDGRELGYEHPYEVELDLYRPPPKALELEEAILPPSLEETNVINVDTEEDLDRLVDKLSKATVFSVDVEHHSYRTYQGITCLLQISIENDADYIIDALKLRDVLHKLNEAFTNSKIIKVFHGAESDIKWLQRDFGVYVVGLFDTYHAAKLLGMPRLALSYLIFKYCGITMNKSFQLADWRIRPLPEELIEYARMDTHFLTYIWRRLKADLLKLGNGQPGKLIEAFERSTATAKLTYTKPLIHDKSHMSIYIKSKKAFNFKQLTALKILYQWRDSEARLNDESAGYVLPNHMLVKLSEELPREIQGIHACCSPMPPLVKQNIQTIHRIILSCRTLPSVAPAITSTEPTADTSSYQETLNTEIHDASEERYSELSGATTTSDAIPDDVDQKPLTAFCLFNSVKPISQEVNQDPFEQPLETPPARYFKYRSIVRVREEQDYLAKEKQILALNEQRQPKEELVEVEVLEALKFTTKKDGPNNVATDDNKNIETHPADKININLYKDTVAKQSVETNKSISESDVLKLSQSEHKSKNKKRKHEKSHDVKPYDYKNVDYGRFTSKNQHDQHSRRKRKRK